VAWVGAITALYAATVALVQNDIKRVLAYSTISQLGYMFLAAGVGAYGAAIFHMVTHAFFKALLFLGAGSAIHGVHDEQDMRKMGGLRKFMPVTAGTFIVGWLAIAGVFPFAGFWSKDEILARAWFAHDYALWAVGLVAALFTAFYMTRQVYLVFFGNERWNVEESEHAAAAAITEPEHEPAAAHQPGEHGHGEPHESPWLMLFPLIALAALSTIGGLVDLPFTHANLDFLDRWLEPVLVGTHAPEITSFGGAFVLSTIALVVAVVGIVIGRAMYLNGLPADNTDPLVERLGGFAKVLENGYYLNYGVARFVSGPATYFARFLNEGIDRDTIDGAVNGIASAAREGGNGLRRVQTGLVRNYALAIVAGAVLLIVYMATRATF